VSTSPTQNPHETNSRPPRTQDLVQAVLTISEGLPCPDRYLRGLLELVDAERARRRGSERAA
jgi:hypothetical protein